MLITVLIHNGEGELSQRTICERCDMGKQTVSAICKRLGARDFVTAHSSEADKRERIMVLTDEGREWWSQSVERMRELETFIKVIERYAKTFQEEVQR